MPTRSLKQIEERESKLKKELSALDNPTPAQKKALKRIQRRRRRMKVAADKQAERDKAKKGGGEAGE